MNLGDIFNIAIITENTLQDWLMALLFIVISYILLQFIKHFAANRLHKLASRTLTDVDDFITELLAKTNTILLLIFSIYFGSLRLQLGETLWQCIRVITIFGLLLQIGFWVTALINFWVNREAKKKDTAGGEATTLNVLGMMMKIAAWVLIILIALDNIPGVEITTLVASLGIGGIAVGLAVQSILSDLFASVSIALDKPFVIGDSIVVDELSGTVEHLGLKSVRVRSLSGEQIVFSTSDLLDSRIHNYQKMNRRRAVLKFGITYQTSHEKVAGIPDVVQEIISAQEKVSFERSHFTGFGASALDFETVYWMEEPSYALYLDTQQAINLEIIRRFEAEGIEFAYPTQTIILDK